MSPIEWVVIAIVVLITLCLGSLLAVVYIFSGKPGEAMGYTREHGHCPNMGACDGCDMCEED